MSATDDMSGRLFDYAVSRPEGFTRDEASRALDITRWTFVRAVRRLRLVLGDDDTINLIANKPGPEAASAQWVYQLVGSAADALWWSNNRRRDVETRLRTIYAVNHSMVAAAKANTRDGRHARVMEKGLSRLIEDLDELNVEV